MIRQEIRMKLSLYSNGGNAYLLLDYLLDKRTSEIFVSQDYLAKELNKTRPSIHSSLKLLHEIGVIEYGYGKIKFKEEL